MTNEADNRLITKLKKKTDRMSIVALKNSDIFLGI